MVDTLDSALLIYGFSSEKLCNESKNCGIFISNEWVLTSAMLLDTTIIQHHAVWEFLRELNTETLTMVPLNIMGLLRFTTCRQRDKLSETSLGVVVAAWKCPLLTYAFDNIFLSWTFYQQHSHAFKHLLRTIFLVIRILPYNLQSIDLASVESALRYLYSCTGRQPVQGMTTEIVTAPFGSSLLLNSVTQGIVSNVIGPQNCIILTDATVFPNGEGSPVYLFVPPSRERFIIGLVIASMCRYKEDWVHYGIIANLSSCLQCVISNLNPMLALSEHEGNELDRSIVKVKCGKNSGTGILVDRDTGTFLTCAHIFNKELRDLIWICPSNGESDEKRKILADLVFRTPHKQAYDIAVLKVNPKLLHPTMRSMKFFNASIMPGVPLLAIGYSFFNQASICRAVVSKMLDSYMLVSTGYIQSGFSGGALISKQTGEMFGMVVSNTRYTSQNGFLTHAIPITVLSQPLQLYMRTNNADVFYSAFVTTNELVNRNWKGFRHDFSKI